MSFSWNNIPFRPNRCPFFYGWIIMLAATVTMIASIPGQTIGVGVFADFLIMSLGISRVQLSAAYMAGTMGSSFILPFAGRAIDRFGIRIMVVVVSIGLGFSLATLASLEYVINLKTVRSTAFVMTVIIITFMLIRFFGQGCLTVISRIAIGKWFNHRRGLATAISGIFVTFSFNASPLYLNSLIQSYGWKEVSIILAVAVGIFVSLISWIFYRDAPEDCGLVMDGNDDPAWLNKMSGKIPNTRKEFNRSEALQTRSFWLFSAGLSAQALVITAVTFHIASIGSGVGLSRPEVFQLFLPMSGFAIMGSLLSGWISDQVKLKWLLMIQQISLSTGTLALLYLGSHFGQALFSIGYGISGGIFSTLVTVTWPRFFGRKHLGAISSLNMSIIVFASAVGPVVFSLGQSLTSSYISILIICGMAPLIVAIASLKADNPQEKITCELA